MTVSTTIQLFYKFIYLNNFELFFAFLLSDNEEIKLNEFDIIFRPPDSGRGRETEICTEMITFLLA